MLSKIFGNAFKVLAQKSFKLWGLSILSTVLVGLVWILFAIPLGLAIFISMLLQAGVVMMYLHAYRGEKVEGKHLFDAFKDGKTASRTIKGIGWSNILIFLWGLIPIVGPIFAIIRSYQYSLVPYIVVTETNGDPFDAYKISKERTQGYCGQMFLADLIPCVVITVVFAILGALCQIPYAGVIFAIITAVLGIVVAFLYPFFMGLVHAGFYDEIMKNANNAPAPVASAAPAAAKFCPNCGAPKPVQAANACPNCGYIIPDPSNPPKFCPECGTKLQ
jgi:hypothetical protein